MHTIIKSYPIINIQKGSPSYGRMTNGNIDYKKYLNGYGPDWRPARGLEIDIFYHSMCNIPETLKLLEK